VNPGTLVGRVNDTEVRASLPGEVRAMLQSEGATVSAGDPIVDLSPDENHAWEALRALYLVGEGEDIEEVQRYARGAPGMSPKLKQQAVLTLERIVKRSEK
jgi:multidrug efflux pump subunit AcrA (membrane-fusion protein)